jgi:hypothetical protein
MPVILALGRLRQKDYRHYIEKKEGRKEGRKEGSRGGKKGERKIQNDLNKAENIFKGTKKIRDK